NTISALTGGESPQDQTPDTVPAAADEQQHGAPAEPIPLHAQAQQPDAAAGAATATMTEAQAPAMSAPAAVANGAGAEADDDTGEETMASLLNSPANAIRDLNRGDVLEGVVARVDQDEVLVDIGMKSEGVIPARE